MNRDEDVTLGTVGQAGALAKRNHSIVAAGRYHFEAAALQKQAKPLLDVQRDFLFQYAREAGLDMKRFEHSLDVEQAKPLIDADAAEAKALGITGTPAFFVNGRYLSGAKPFDEFAQVINAELVRLKLPVPAPPLKRDAKAGG